MKKGLSKALPGVLVVEDDAFLQETYADLLEDTIAIQAAFTIEEARTKFAENDKTLAAIVVDACVPGHIPNTMPLIQWMRANGFMSPIIATSSEPDYREKLMQAGCSHQCSKKDVTKLLQALL